MFSFGELRQFASVTQTTDVIGFLKAVQVIPYDVTHISAPDYVNTNLDPDRIPAGYLAALGYEWIKDGPSTPLEFIDSLRPEMRDSPEREVVREALEAGDFNA